MARPTNDPKGTMLAVRVAARHVEMLGRRAARDQVSVSEALRRYLDEAAQGQRSPRSRLPNAEERETFDQVFAALGLEPRLEPPRRRRRER